MSFYGIINPYPVILNQIGGGLNAGKVFIGTAGQDPETSPIQVYWDAAGTVPASQPLSTIGGYITRSGTPAQVYGPVSYSIRIRDRFNVQVAYSAQVNSIFSSSQGASQIGTTGGGTVQDFIDGIGDTISTSLRTDPIALGDSTYAQTLGDIIGRTGLTPQMMPGFTVEAADHSPFINEAIDRLIGAGGGRLWFPAISGDWKIGSSINCHKAGYQSSHVILSGVGERPLLRWLGSTGDMFNVGDGTNPVYDVTIENFYLTSAVTRTDGKIINARKANLVKFKNLVAQGVWNGFYGEDLNTCLIEDCQFIYPSSGTSSGVGITIYSDPSGATRTDEVVISRSTVQANLTGASGMTLSGRVATIMGDRIGLLGVVRGLQVNSAVTGLANIPQFITMRTLEVDRASGSSVVIDNAYNIEFSDRCDLINTSGAGGITADNEAVIVNSGAEQVRFMGGRVGNCRKAAMAVYGKNVKLIGTTLTDMAKDIGGSYSGLYLGPTANGFSVNDCTIEGSGRATYALGVDASAANGNVLNTIYKGVVTGFSTGTGTNVTISGQKLATY